MQRLMDVGQAHMAQQMAEAQMTTQRLVNQKLELEHAALRASREAMERQAEAWSEQAEYWRQKRQQEAAAQG